MNPVFVENMKQHWQSGDRTVRRSDGARNLPKSWNSRKPTAGSRTTTGKKQSHGCTGGCSSSDEPTATTQLSIPKSVLLEDLTGWNIDVHQQELDEAWRARLTSLIEFAATYHRTPRYQNYSSEAERILGVRLHVQHQRRAEGTMLPWRLEMMDTAFLHWQSRM